MKTVLCSIVCVFVGIAAASADLSLTTQKYVDTKVSANAGEQTMKGDYTVTGKMVVPTPALPEAE